MILTQCAACAAPLGLSLGKKCGRCSTRYCGAECQVQHWKEGGHDKLCKAIKKAGGAEQYNANQKYTAAVTVAAEACADDTKGQTCYICTQALHWKTKEGLVRMCACRGTAGFAHVSCLAEQAKILVAEAEENNLGSKVLNERFDRWHTCGLCEQNYHGVVRGGLGWGCWKTYLGRSELDLARRFAMQQLGNGLYHTKHYEDALTVEEALLLMLRRAGASEQGILTAQNNIARTYQLLGRHESALNMYRDVLSGYLKLLGESDTFTIMAASNYASALHNLNRFEEAKALLSRTMPVAQRVLGESNELTITIKCHYSWALYEDTAATLGDLREAVTSLDDTERTARRVLGGGHPTVLKIEKCLQDARAALRARSA